MRKVIGIGETVLDLIFKDEQPTAAVFGGSSFNTLISLGRSGIPTVFVCEASSDRIGKQMISFLKKNGIDSQYVAINQYVKSALSLAFLNEQNDAEYLFYKDHPEEWVEFAYPEIASDDIVLFGSFYALNPVIRIQVESFLKYAREKGAILFYDVNFRSSHTNEIVKITPALIENFEFADIVRGSTDDFENIFRTRDADKIYKDQIAFYCSSFICTDGAYPVSLRTRDVVKCYLVKKVDTISTIGAGDAFNAGLIYALIKERIGREQLLALDEKTWDKLLENAFCFSAQVCTSLDNYVDISFGEKMKIELQTL